ncbi:acyl-CoA dehydrogenase [Corynebacterium sphenisci DSM 44792]|uniref:Acyl-CoA dehydrogenase n=1 Tax=Corynebacterium sphenisci DSM 44792 TaxID=1437874 RepID=A0A1L7CYR6_9CORY|nr:acyl-CoA dehydrogenase family protein [Corynebacterium sphenisci]APT90933.1 acyl-CoA dehydrogenase [Corynebacterium sphenisci DSM 44792]
MTTEAPELRRLRLDVRRFLAEKIKEGRFTPSIDTWLTRWDEDFTRELAAHGWVGMTIPVEYGGHGRSFVERFVVTEELLAVGAPVAAQWVADRQIAPSLLAHGTEAQKREYLPRIAAGECCFAIGMSEPDSGSDLASVRTRAERVEGGWRVTGTKVWTSGAQHSEAFFCLARTAPVDPADRHAGLSQFLLDLRTEGVTIRPIESMSGSRHFSEVILDGVFVADDMVFGDIGAGWRQVNSELAFERSGPERFLSSFRLFAEALAPIGGGGPVLDEAAGGRALARLAGLHGLSRTVADTLQAGGEADVPAALVKVLGTATEGDLVDLVDAAVGDEADHDPALRELLRAGVVQRPGFTLRGGTNEILRGVIARGLELR